MDEITSKKLLSFNGKEGKPVYIAFQGKIYDVSQSPLWSKGLHMNSHSAGRELSGEFAAAPHGMEVFERYPQVGILKREMDEELKHLPPSIQNLLKKFPMARRHPHPMIVHFPIALLMTSSLFILLYLIFKNPSFETTGFYLFVLGAIASPFAMATGLFTWWVNYRLKLNVFVKRKIQFSILLLIFMTILILLRISQSQIAHPVYFILTILLAPIVSILGYYGGQMIFPVSPPLPSPLEGEGRVGGKKI